MRLIQEEEDESALSAQALLQVRDAIRRDADRLKRNKVAVTDLALATGLTVKETMPPGEALKRGVAAQLEVVETMGRKVQSAPTPVEAQQWQIMQRAAFDDLRAAQESLREFEARQVEAAENRASARLRVLGGMSLGVVAIAAGAAVSLLGHPYVGLPIAGAGGGFIQQALGKSRVDGKEKVKK